MSQHIGKMVSSSPVKAEAIPCVNVCICASIKAGGFFVQASCWENYIWFYCFEMFSEMNFGEDLGSVLSFFWETAVGP